jgi:hypothetical protein
MRNKSLFQSLAFLVVGCALGPTVAEAANKNYILVKLETVWISNDQDIADAGPEGEIQYLAVVATKPDGQSEMRQTTGFPVENWYEAEDGGRNAHFLDGSDRGIPLFCYPEDKMGDELVLSFSVLDDDGTSEIAIAGHKVAATVGTAVATAWNPAVGATVKAVSGEVQKALEQSEDLDVIGTHTAILRRSDRWGWPEGRVAKTYDQTSGDMRVRYTVQRITTRDQEKNWCVAVTLNPIKIVEDGDGDAGPFGDDGEIYIRARVADGYAGEFLDQKTTHLPSSGTKDVGAGHSYPKEPKKLYSNLSGGKCQGLPPFLYTEVGVFEDDSGGYCGGGRACDEALGVLPLMLTSRWLREHPGTNPFEYTVTGNDAGSEKARISLKIEVWNPAADPDAPISGTARR